MDAKTNGALPATAFNENGPDGYYTTHYGLTKRELFAAMAMQGMCASGEYATATGGQIAAYSVECADALLAALTPRVRAVTNAIEVLKRIGQYVPNDEFAAYFEAREALEAAVEAATELRARQRDYLSQPKGERIEAKGRLVGVAATRLDAALARVEGTP